jgi:hypothetical protein
VDQTSVAKIDPKFLIERNGRPFVLYAGLLDCAHKQGLRAIRTHLIQVPMEENSQTAIVSAEVETERGLFSGIGDASPANVSRAMLTATIRLAETRAKARALRDAVNIGVTAFEEIDGEPREVGDPSVPTPAPRPAIAPPTSPPAAAHSAPTPIHDRVDASAGSPPATEAQLRAIKSIAESKHLDLGVLTDSIHARHGVGLDGLTRQQAAAVISQLNGGQAASR